AVKRRVKAPFAKMVGSNRPRLSPAWTAALAVAIVVKVVAFSDASSSVQERMWLSLTVPVTWTGDVITAWSSGAAMATVGAEVSVGSMTESVALAVAVFVATSEAVATTAIWPSVSAVYWPRPLASSAMAVGVPPGGVTVRPSE